MCTLKVLDHTGRGGCGHVFVTDVERCLNARLGQHGRLCVYPQTRRIVPNTGVWRELVRWFSAGPNKVAGKCPACYSGTSDAQYEISS